MRSRKNILFNLTIILLLACTACDRSTRHVTENLSQAEELIWTAPDSALHILESIPTSRHLIGKEHADYVLLLSLAQYRCYIPVSSDSSMIDLAVEYYKDKNDADKKGKALYIKGCVWKEKYNDIPNALIAYKEAETCISDMKERHYVAHIYSSLGYIYEKSLNFELAKEYYQKALQENRNIKDITSQASDLLNLLGLYHIVNDTDSINQCITSLLKCSGKLKDSILQSKIYHNIAVSKMYQEKYEEAESFFSCALHISPASPSYKTMSGLAQLYMKKGQKERADSLFQNALLSKDLSLRAYIYNQLYDEAWKAENYKKIAQYARLYIDTSDSIYNSHLHQEVLKVQRKYDHMQLLYQKSRQTNIIYSSIIIIFIVSGILWFLFIQYKKKRKEEKEELTGMAAVWDYLKTFLIIFCVVFAMNKLVYINAVIPSESMQDTIMKGDRVLGNRLAYIKDDPERYDIVIFKYPDDPSKIFIKRVIGLPGETVTVKDGKIYIDGKEQTQAVSFCPEEMAGSFGPYEVPEDSYFVMGDNRNNSLDSRYWDNTYVKKEAILAKAGFRYWPLNKVGFVNKSAEK